MKSKAGSLWPMEVQAVINRLVSVPVGDVISYAQCAEAIGRPFGVRVRSVLAAARLRAQRNHRAVFRVLYNVGLVRLSDQEVACTGQEAIGKIHRAAGRGVRKLAAIQDFAALPNELKRRHNVDMAMLGAVRMWSGRNAMKRFESKVLLNDVPPPQAALAMFLEADKRSARDREGTVRRLGSGTGPAA